MKGTASKNAWSLALLIFTGIVLGSFIGSLVDNISAFNWLNYGQSFGLDSPIVLNLGVLVLTFGLNVRITIASVVGIILAIFIYRKL